MAAGDQYRRIEPSDMLVFDDENNLVGLRSGKSDSAEMRLGAPLTAAQVQEMQRVLAINGTRRALLAASGTDALTPAQRSRAVTKSGTYTGNGTSVSVSLGWTPDFIVVKGDNTEQARFWARGAWYDRTDSLTDLESTGGGIAPTEDGFSVGAAASVNTNAATHHYFAYRDNGSGSLLTSSYMGNATAGRVVDVFAEIPLAAAIIKRDGARSVVFALADRATSSDYLGATAADAVIASDGLITLSTSIKVNEWTGGLGEGMHVIAVPTDSTDVAVIVYTGSATARRLPLPFEPDFFLITPRGATGGSGQMWFSSLSTGQHLPTGAGAAGTGRITSVDGAGVLLSTHASVNNSGTEFVLLAFRRSRGSSAQPVTLRSRHSKAVHLSSNGYIDCGTSDTLRVSGPITLEWYGAIYPSSTTPFATAATANDEAGKQYPLIFRSSGADGVAGNCSYGLSGLCPRQDGSGATGGDWGGIQVAWATHDVWDMPVNASPASLDPHPAFSGVIMGTGRLRHILLTHDGAGTWRLYVDGRMAKERKRDLVAAIGRPNIASGAGHRTIIGGRQRATTVDHTHNHQFCLARVYARELTKEEALNNYAAIFGLADEVSGFVEEWDARNASGATMPATVNAANDGTIVNGSVI